MVPLEFASLSQMSEGVELDSVLGPVGPGYEENDMSSYKMDSDEASWWAGGLRTHSFDVLRSVSDFKSSLRNSSSSAPS